VTGQFSKYRVLLCVLVHSQKTAHAWLVRETAKGCIMCVFVCFVYYFVTHSTLMTKNNNANNITNKFFLSNFNILELCHAILPLALCFNVVSSK
jgi:hypothetical protein